MLLVGSYLLQYISLVSSTNKTDRRDIAEILLKVALNTLTLTPLSLSLSLFLSFWVRVTLWCFNSYIVAVSFIGGGKLEYTEKTIELSQRKDFLINLQTKYFDACMKHHKVTLTQRVLSIIIS
jgi:hypothetical protein